MISTVYIVIFDDDVLQSIIIELFYDYLEINHFILILQIQKVEKRMLESATQLGLELRSPQAEGLPFATEHLSFSNVSLYFPACLYIKMDYCHTTPHLPRDLFVLFKALNLEQNLHLHSCSFNIYFSLSTEH